MNSITYTEYIKKETLLKQHNNILLTHLSNNIMNISENEVLRIAINNLLDIKKVWIEEYSFYKPNYKFKNFEGIKTMLLSEYDFLVLFWNDFRNEGNIKYEIYIPYNFLDENIDENKGIYLYDLLTNLKSGTEKKIFDYLKDRNLIEEIISYE